jgi:hypothetical protein
VNSGVYVGLCSLTTDETPLLAYGFSSESKINWPVAVQVGIFIMSADFSTDIVDVINNF